MTVTPPAEPDVAFCTLVMVRVPAPTLISVTAAGVASLKRLICPENVVLVPSNPTVSVGETVLLVTVPAPASEPRTVLLPSRFRRVPAASESAEKREPAFPLPIWMPPADTFTGPVKMSCALNCKTPVPVLLMPPAEPITPCSTSPAVDGAKSVKPANT